MELIITLAHKMNLKVIAEGIESARQIERLLELGCEFGPRLLLLAADGTESCKAVQVRQQVAHQPKPPALERNSCGADSSSRAVSR